MSAVIRQMVLRKRAAVVQAEASALAHDQIVASAKGKPGLVWHGEWDKATEYAPDDAVSCKGSSYVAVEPSLDDRPPSAAWNLLAAKGKDGKAGTDGKNGVVALAGGGGRLDLDALPIADGSTPEEIALKQNGVWVRMTWSAFLALIGTPLPAGTTTVNGEPVTVNGEYVTTT